MNFEHSPMIHLQYSRMRLFFYVYQYHFFNVFNETNLSERANDISLHVVLMITPYFSLSIIFYEDHHDFSISHILYFKDAFSMKWPYPTNNIYCPRYLLAPKTKLVSGTQRKTLVYLLP